MVIKNLKYTNDIITIRLCIVTLFYIYNEQDLQKLVDRILECSLWKVLNLCSRAFQEQLGWANQSWKITPRICVNEQISPCLR